MRSKREMSVRQFERRHPDLTLSEIKLSENAVGYMAYRQSKPYAANVDITLRRALYHLSEACYRLAALDQMEAQGWKDANSGETGVPLEAHHIVKRSAGRLDSQENLVGVSRRTHDAQHGQVEFTKK